MTTMLSNAEAAALIGVTPKTLNWWRHIGRGPKFIKYGTHRCAGVRYDPADIEAWKAERKFNSTTEYSAAARASVNARNGNVPPPRNSVARLREQPNA